jgi:hypothetical protein
MVGMEEPTERGNEPMRRFAILCSLSLSCLGIPACSDDAVLEPIDAATTGAPDASTGDDGAFPSPIDTVGIDGGAAPLRGIVVIHSDYRSGSVSFLDRDGNLIPGKDGCINSGTGTPGLSLAISEDLALPSQTVPGDAVVIIDRGNDSLLWLDPATCAPVRQMSVATGFASNPHDFVELGANKAYVPRYKPNLAATPAPGDFDDGNDVLIVDPSQASIVGRIDLLPFTPAGFLPRADRALLIDGKVYLSLNATDARFNDYATGRIVMIDPTLDQVTGVIDLPGLENCGAMTYLPAEKKLLVACTGNWNAGPEQVAASGIAILDTSVSPPALSALLMAASIGDRPLSNSTVGALDSNTILAVALGDFTNVPPDAAWVLAQNGAAPIKLYSSVEGNTLAAALVDAERGRVFLTDGTTTSASVRIFDRVAGSLTETGQVKTNLAQKLPPRGLAWF